MRVAPIDHLRVALRGLQGHPLRFALSALGIAVGIAAMVAVAGITQSSKAALADQLDALGTNLVRVYPAPNLDGEPTRLPATAQTMLGNIGPVEETAGVAQVDGVGVYRSPYVPAGNTNSLVVAAASPSLADVLHAEIAEGHWFTEANSDFPTVVLGSSAARRLAISDTGVKVWIDQQWWVVVGILEPMPLAVELNAAALVPMSAATTYLGIDGTLTGVYLRAPDTQVVPVSDVVPQTASPEQPEYVGIDRPADALTATLAADAALSRLLLGLATIGLLVGGIGVSNTMIIAVIERRAEVGLRRALGATRTDVGVQFLVESTLMSLTGGIVGALLGYGVTATYAFVQGWIISLPVWVGGVAVGLTTLVGSVAGLYPAIKASLAPPTEALASA